MLPKVATLDNYGGAKNDFGAPRDSTTDRPANGVNPAFADVAAMTHCAPRAFCAFTPAGTGTPTIVAGPTGRDEDWNNGNNNPPTVARTGTGTFTVTYPSTVLDEIPANAPGATPGGFALLLRRAWVGLELGSTTNYEVRAKVSAANVVTVSLFTVGTSTLVDINDGTNIVVFAL